MKVSKAVVERLREIANEKDISLYKLQKDSGMPEGTFLSLIIFNKFYLQWQTLSLCKAQFFDYFDDGEKVA